MSQALVTQILLYLIPAIGAFVPGILKQDGFSDTANSILATVVVALVAGLQCWAAGQYVMSPYLDFGITVTAMGALLAGPFKDFDAWLQSNVGFTSSKPVQV